MKGNSRWSVCEAILHALQDQSAALAQHAMIPDTPGANRVPDLVECSAVRMNVCRMAR